MIPGGGYSFQGSSSATSGARSAGDVGIGGLTIGTQASGGRMSPWVIAAGIGAAALVLFALRRR